MKELTERGLQLFSEIRSSERAASMRQLIEDKAFGSALVNVAVDSVFCVHMDSRRTGTQTAESWWPRAKGSRV
jgi:hypothetical protein